MGDSLAGNGPRRRALPSPRQPVAFRRKPSLCSCAAGSSAWMCRPGLDHRLPTASCPVRTHTRVPCFFAMVQLVAAQPLPPGNLQSRVVVPAAKARRFFATLCFFFVLVVFDCFVAACVAFSCRAFLLMDGQRYGRRDSGRPRWAEPAGRAQPRHQPADRCNAVDGREAPLLARCWRRCFGEMQSAALQKRPFFFSLSWEDICNLPFVEKGVSLWPRRSLHKSQETAMAAEAEAGGLFSAASSGDGALRAQ